eukprot:scaffold259_cov158-Amphora_coffeaeformis.AAC.9
MNPLRIRFRLVELSVPNNYGSNSDLVTALGCEIPSRRLATNHRRSGSKTRSARKDGKTCNRWTFHVNYIE